MSGGGGILLGALLFLPWLEGGATPEGLLVVHTSVFAAAAAVLIRSRRAGLLDVRLPWPFVAYAVLAGVGVVSFLRAQYLFGSFETSWDQIVGLVLALTLCSQDPPERFRRFSWLAVAAAAAAQAALAVVTRLSEGAAASISFLNPNHTAAYLNVAAFLALEEGGAGLIGSRRRPSAPWLALAVLCAAGTVAIGSRGGLLALTLTILMFLSVRAPARRRLLTIALPAVAALAAAAFLSVQARFARTDDPYRYDRPRLWAAALEAWREAPLLGLGPGMYEHRSLRHNFPQERAVFRFSKEPHSAHSQPLQVLAEEGAAGAAALATFAALVLAALGRRAAGGEGEASRAARGLLPAFTCLAIHSLVETPLEAPAIPLTLAILAWPALRPARIADAAAAFSFRWPSAASSGPDGDSGPGAVPGPHEARRAARAVGISAAAAMLVLWAFGILAPYLSFALGRYAESPGRSPERIDLAVRLSESFNPYQPFLGYRRARAALGRASRLSPPLLSNAAESLERTIRLEPGDPSAYVLLAHLHARAAAEFPGAGPGVLEAAERRYGEAIALSPFDARLRVARAAFRLSRGRPRQALADAEEALRLEPRALAAHQLKVEALLAAGDGTGAAAALRGMDRAAEALRGFTPLNDYEAALLRVDVRDLERAREALRDSLLFVPA